MPFTRYCHSRSFLITLGILSSWSCASEEAGREIALRSSPLELSCATALPDLATDVTSIPSSIEPFDPSRSQAYGSSECSGFIFEFDNPDGEALHGLWIQASGESSASSDALGESQCPERELEVDSWGYEKREWSKLASSSARASFEVGGTAGTGYCRLEALIDQPGAFERYRVVARVTDGSETYPMIACLW